MNKQEQKILKQYAKADDDFQNSSFLDTEEARQKFALKLARLRKKVKTIKKKYDI